MAADTQVTVPFINGGSVSANLNMAQDGSGNFSHQFQLRYAGALTTELNPQPVWPAIGPAVPASFGSKTITTAVTNSVCPSPAVGIGRAKSVSLLATFTWGSGGTTTKVYVQTSFDGGTTWYDIKQFAFTTASAVKWANVSTDYGVTSVTPTTGTMTDDDVQQGVLGDRLRYVVTSTGTYAGSTSVKVEFQVR